MGEVDGENERNADMVVPSKQPAEIFSSSSAFASHFEFTAGVGEGKSL